MTGLKTVLWSGNAISGTNPSATFPLEGTQVVPVGELHRIVWKNTSSAGSLYFFESGTDLKIATLTAGSNVLDVTYPATKYQDNTGTDAAAGDNLWRSFIVTNPLYFTGSGLTSGTSNKIGEIRADYKG